MARRLFYSAIFLGLCQGVSVADDYPNAQLLVESADLAKPKSTIEINVLDVRERSKYDQGHVPGAYWIDHAAWAAAFGDGSDDKRWGYMISDLGIGSQSKVVIYDDGTAKDAARIWWILRYWGIEEPQLLNGGWTGWTTGKFPVETEPHLPEMAGYVAIPHAKQLATKDQLLGGLKSRSLQIVDARSEAEFCGTAKLKNKRAGSIPGAKHLEWSELIEKETQRFKPPAEIRELFERAGIDVEQPTATHCQSGGRSSVMAFALELMGGKQVRNYYRGWSEWGNADDTLIVPGEAKR
jgi:thiosulfate/3-mercaptopyruvate sulfurtransferase